MSDDEGPHGPNPEDEENDLAVDDVDPDDDDDLVSEMDPEDPILLPVQQRYERQLRKQLEEVALNLKETNTELKKVKTGREDVGVELYNVQQQLAKLQEQLEKGHDNMMAVAKLKDQKEKERDVVVSQFEGDKAKVDELRRKYFKYQSELDKLAETLLRVEQFNEQMQSEISIERRAAYKAEEEISNLEKQKKHQDYLIDQLNEQIKQLTEKLALYESQLDSQKKETRIAQETLSDALAEMEAINFEKKQLLQQWKTSLIGMQRRDEALRATEDALEQQKEALLSLDNEITGYKQSIKKEQERNERLTQSLSKTENEVNFLEKQIDTLLEKKQKANDKFTMLKRSMEHTDNESKRVDQEVKGINNEVDGINKKTQKVVRDVRVLEEKVMETLSSQTTLKKGSQSTLQAIEKLKSNIRDKELQVTQMENELARIRVDTLQTQAHNEVLKGTVAELEKELAANDYLIERMQVDIRRKHDEIERKQKNLDKLNRQYDECLVQQGGESSEGLGPLEATINNLSKAIAVKSTENDQLQRDWIKAQTELVNTKNYSSKLHDGILELKAQATILQQKKMRLTNNAKQQTEEINQLQHDMAMMHQKQKKLNELISANSTKQEGVSNDSYNLENDLILRLQERKMEAIALENKIEDMKEEKQRLLNDILEAERQIMFWEKKIQIAKETEMALDPNVGKEEINRMKQEIYIMEQRLANLKKEQKRKIEEMTKAIDHREVLRDKGKAIQANVKTGVTKVQLQRDNARLSNELQKRKAEAQQKDKQIKACLQNTENTISEVEKVKNENDRFKEQLNQLQREIHVQTVLRSKVWDEKARKQKTHHRYRDVEKGQYKFSVRPDNYEREKGKVEERKRVILEIVGELVERCPNMQDDLRMIASSLFSEDA
jgi:chromosome segregation ATPase|mmetsp:Transcript_3423/g.6560  ORF Transcript_3423/g.6560 Transcript_3423/m.6560 type:complete len:895 (+) Transcript_3423:42-2726(+)|eukprot:CAMPEP_0174356508 /NCGR_PEP_ID=MMETSP0811_2-20130205/30566_1 /TAXON_ID=73025 ORGANISM="Eutreptiella gymnastica-like, Strain CCMP1594" /NCGR_SAMPLE_ID=MMETSP0811_2 /ASSEMBLY_ACC=CAM_ASM_000667 /LENGTH=894 /DNA_ID=CAMNT_0015488597 /DNA_START=42 /DNA_END=2726 /DNA_ORIENTATION=-